MQSKYGLLPLSLSLLLVGCGNTVPGPESTEEPGRSVGATALVTFRIDFPDKPISTQGTPVTAMQADVRVFDGATVIGTATIRKSNGTTAAQESIKLPVGKALRIETSVKNGTSTEIAWGSTTQAVSADQVVSLPFKSVLSNVTLSEKGELPEGKELGLNVYSTDGSPVPLNDFNVEYTVSNGIATNRSKLGVFVAPTSSLPISVTATVKGLGVDHKEVTIQQTLNTSVNSALVAKGKLANWPTGLQAPAQIIGAGVTGSVQVDGTFEMRLPQLTQLDTSSVLKKIAEISEIAPLTPSDLQALTGFIELPSFSLGGKIAGTLEAVRPGLPSGTLGSSNSKSLILVYSDRALKISGNVYVSGGSKSVDISLQKGWNLVYQTSWWRSITGSHGIGGYEVGSIPIVTDGVTTTTDLGFAEGRIADASVTQDASSVTPLEGAEIQHSINIYSGASFNYGEQKFTIDIPSSLLLMNQPALASSFSSSRPCAAPVSTAKGIRLDCTVNLSTSAIVSFTTKAQPLSLVPQDPGVVTVALADQIYYDPNTVNNVSRLSFTRQAVSSVSLTADLQPPVITFDRPGFVSKGQEINLSGTATDNVQVVQVEVYEGVKMLSRANLTDSVWKLPWRALKSGAHQFTAVAYDAAGNTTKQSLEIQVQ